jgi:peptide deformylase
MIRAITQLGNPQLRLPTDEVEKFGGPEIERLIEDLLESMEATGGVGIAAPQIGLSVRVCIVASRPNERYPYAPTLKPIAMLNPHLEWTAPTTAKDWEGCLSVPGIRGLVPRSTHVRVRYTEPQTGRVVVQEYRGFVARVVQHELDHLDGLVFLDRVESTRELASEQECRRIMAENKK